MRCSHKTSFGFSLFQWLIIARFFKKSIAFLDKYLQNIPCKLVISSKGASAFVYNLFAVASPQFHLHEVKISPRLCIASPLLFACPTAVAKPRFGRFVDICMNMWYTTSVAVLGQDTKGDAYATSF